LLDRRDMRAPTLALVFALALSTAVAHAQRADPLAAWDRAPACAGPGDFTFGRLAPQLRGAIHWACSRDHVIALLRASHTPFAQSVYQLDAGPIVWTSDRGRTWHQSGWEWPDLPRAIAFDPGSGWGLAVGDNGAVWSSNDGGASFVDHGDAPPASFVDVLVLDRVGVARDDRGDYYVLREDGLDRVRIAHAPDGWMEHAGETIVVHAPSGDVRVTRSGSFGGV
jgi:hypothetical protein